MDFSSHRFNYLIHHFVKLKITYCTTKKQKKIMSEICVTTYNLHPRSSLIELTVAASFVFVWLAKEGHAGPVSVNYLEKIQIPHVYHLTGAMLAGVDFVTMGAGITLQIPGVLDTLSKGGSPNYNVFIEGSKNGTEKISFVPQEFFGEKLPDMNRPGFFPAFFSS